MQLKKIKDSKSYDKQKKKKINNFIYTKIQNQNSCN